MPQKNDSLGMLFLINLFFLKLHISGYNMPKSLHEIKGRVYILCMRKLNMLEKTHRLKSCKECLMFDTTSKKSLVTKRITVDLFIDREASSPA